MKITKLRIIVEPGQVNHIVKPQCFDESSNKWKDFMENNKPIIMRAVRGKVHGMELSHITNKNVQRAKKKASSWLEDWKKTTDQKDLVIEDIKPKNKDKTKNESKRDKKSKLDKVRCDRCGRLVNMITLPKPDEILCVYCKAEGNINIETSEVG